MNKPIQTTRPIPAHEPSEDRRQRKLEQSLERITAVAWALFEEHGYENVTMETISLQADIAKATLYKYFPVKEALLEHRFKSEMQSRKELIVTQLMQLDSLRERLAYLFHIEAEYLDDKRSYLAPLLRYRMQHASWMQYTSGQHHQNKQSNMMQAMCWIISAAQQQGEITHQHSPERLASYLYAMRSMDLIAWLTDPQESLGKRHEQMLEIFLHGVSMTGVSA